jgi:hypothetical protein
MNDFSFLIPSATLPELDAIGDAREAAGRRGGTYHGWDESPNRTGVYGEYGLCNMPGLSHVIRFEAGVRKDAIDAHQKRLNGDTAGVPLEVKSTWYTTGKLVASRKKLQDYNPEMRLVLVTLRKTEEGVQAVARGWAYAWELLAQPDDPKIGSPAMFQRNLRPMEGVLSA